MSFRKYAEYKESGVEWLGEVPKHWVIGKVKHVTENLDKYRVPLSSMERGNRQGIYPYYGASGIIDYIDDYLFDEDTILFGEDGANLLARSTPLAFLATGKYWVNNHAHVLKAKDGLNRFWVMVLENIDITPVVSGSAQPKLTSEALGNLAIVYPPSIEERRKIIAFLDKETTNIDTLIDKQEQLITLLQEKRQAVISHAVTRGLNPNVKMKDSGIEWLREVPEHWEVRRLKYICRFAYGDSLPSEMRIEGDVPVYGSNGHVGFHSFSNTTAPCIVIGRKGSFGKVNYSSDSAFAIDTTFFVDSKYTTANIRWLYYLLGLLQLDAISKDAIVPGLNREDAYQQMGLFPPLKEQKRIASYLDKETAQIDTLIEKCETAIELLKERRTALISAAVMGKIDVRNVG